MTRKAAPILFILFIFLSAIATADERPGDRGSQVCGEVQLETAVMVASDGPFRNHGQLMRTINEFLNPRIQDRQITGRCAGCIRNQWAQGIDPAEQDACGEESVEGTIRDLATAEFERIRGLIDPTDTTAPEVRFIGSRIEAVSDRWVYVLDRAGRQIFRPVEVLPHMLSAFENPLGPDLDMWQQQRVPEQTVGWAQELALAAFGAGYVFDQDTKIIPVKELVTSAPMGSEVVRQYEGRTSVLFRPASLEEDLAVTYRASYNRNAEGEPITDVRPLEVPSRAYETAVSFAPSGSVVRVESGYLAETAAEFVDLYRQALAGGLLVPQPLRYESTLALGTFFSPNEPRLELTAYSFEGEQFLDTRACEDPENCNPFSPFEPLEYYCFDSPFSLDVNFEIRPSRQYRFFTFDVWHDYGRVNGFRGNWDFELGGWEIDQAKIQVHGDLQDYDLLFPPERLHFHEACDKQIYPYWHSTGNRLEQSFYDDLESCHVAMINTHGGPINLNRVGRPTFQFLRDRDQWATLHEPGDDGLGTGKLRYLLLQTCSSVNWRNNFRNDPKTLFTDWMNEHVADGVRAVGGFDGCLVGGTQTGWRFFGHYHNDESFSQAWIAMGLEEYECNMPIVVAYGSDEDDAARTLFDGRFTSVRGETGWVMAVEPITEEHLEPRACCMPPGADRTCTMKSHFDCEASGGEPLDCGTSCLVEWEKCVE